MLSAYDLHEIKLLQEPYVNSAADALFVNSPTVPAGRIWTVLAATCYPSVAETQSVQVSVASTRAGTVYALTNPVSIALSSPLRYAVVPVGNELQMYPGEYLQFRRGAATAGSSIVIAIRFVETDLPMYAYRDVQHKVMRRGIAPRPISVQRSGGGPGSAPTSSAGRPAGPGGGSGGGSEPY
jgi:hypothetical protein